MTLPTPTQPTIYTIGYEDAHLHEFLHTLTQAGVKLVVDTRERAQSRRQGYSKTALTEALKEQGIGYRHLRALGTPPGIRKTYKLDHDFQALKAGYTLHLATQGDTLHDLAQLAAAQPVALLCYEHEPGECHRSLITGRLGEMGLIGDVVNLKPPRRSKT
ncbi:DUF488 domain-containing protein [Deinococcus cavernae]|uniref:DUF488 domain-containing protein n=1 Tax=Deinococcus cavernae TaxID=2320857 RepID=A0A418VB30_9DEIO|nr:DUF488 domain-containing protein [Deinococcus cavernae]RJF73323.1 DUF488 domain-containing protein [Deinococcus cavernae]